jgi:RNA polymerase sigma-54 factor
VSRATSQKYAGDAARHLPAQYFFSTAIAGTDGGADHSAEVIRQKIRQMIAKEEPQAVLSETRS